MNFDEWVAQLDLNIPDTLPEKKPAEKDKVWRCDGPCGQLMHGVARINNWNYPFGANIPAGNYLGEEYPRVCDLCWTMYNTLIDRNYWVALRARDKKSYTRLKPEGDFLT